MPKFYHNVYLKGKVVLALFCTVFVVIVVVVVVVVVIIAVVIQGAVDPAKTRLFKELDSGLLKGQFRELQPVCSH